MPGKLNLQSNAYQFMSKPPFQPELGKVAMGNDEGAVILPAEAFPFLTQTPAREGDMYLVQVTVTKVSLHESALVTPPAPKFIIPGKAN